MLKLMRRIWARRLWRYALLGGVGFLVFNVAAIHYTSENWFCGSACHIMGSYYDSWKTSVHAEEDVACIDCHIPPGMQNYLAAKINGMGQLVDDVLGRTSGKPSASVSDFSCTRPGCHDLGEVREQTKEEGEFLFDHGKHLVETSYLGINTHCTICHSHVKGDEHFEVNTNACIACHLLSDQPVAEYMQAPDAAVPATAPSAEGDSQSDEKVPTRQCKKCHNPPSEPVEYRGLKVVHAEYVSYGAACESCHHHVTEAQKKVQDSACFSCHDFGAEKVADVAELHYEHSAGEHKVECFSCHGVIRHGPIAEATALEQFDCSACHVNQHAVQQETYEVPGLIPPGVTTASAPSTLPIAPATQPTAADLAESLPVTPMFLAHVDCTGCHVKPKAVDAKPESDATVAAASAEACDRCHKPGLGEQMIPMWQRDTRALYETVEKMLESIAPGDDERTRRGIAEADALLKLIRIDGSWGVHNPRYTQDLLRRAREKLMGVGARPLPMPTTGPAAELSTEPAGEATTEPVAAPTRRPEGVP
ncbi:MAG TPA: hypothetical protein ENH78_06845 [Phycisphaerae bacterium]|nr:hypothetical protein [Phycisphaerae bacterium]